MARRRGDRFHLVVYKLMWQSWAWPSLFILIGSIAAWALAPGSAYIPSGYRPLLLIPGLGALILLSYAYLAQHLAWVQCRGKHIRIQTPIYPLAVSYARIRSVRPSTLAQVLDMENASGLTRAWLKPYWGRTVVVVYLSSYPFNRTWLRLWFSPYVLTPGAPGFVFLVEDWMALSRQIDDFQNQWAMRRKGDSRRAA